MVAPRRPPVRPLRRSRHDDGRHGSHPPRSTARSPAPRTLIDATLPYRRIVYGVLVGALTMFAVAMLDTVAAPPCPCSARSPRYPVRPRRRRPSRARAAVAAGHLPELVAARRGRRRRRRLRPGAPVRAGGLGQAHRPADLPNDQQWRQLVKERCDPIVAGYLKGKLDPDGRYRIGALKPSAVKWSEGDRELRCGLQHSSQSGAFFPMNGKVADSDQSDVQQAGTCLAIDGRGVGDPTDCGGPHAVGPSASSTSRRSGTTRSRPSPTRTPTCSPPAPRSRPTTQAATR